MTDHSARRPHGFAGCRDSWQDILPTDTLRLPGQARLDGAFRRMPEGSFDGIVVQGVAESLGNLEEFIVSAAAGLKPGARLLVDAENLNAPRSLRFALEGRTGCLDPIGNLHDPERRLHRGRLVAAAQDAGLVLEDLFEVPSASSECKPELVQQLFDGGFLPVSYLGGLPPARLWLLAKAVQPKRGSVLVGPGTVADVERTRTALAAFLPDGWEVLTSDDSTTTEAAAFDALIPQSCGDLVWFLRAGSVANASLFEGLRARTILTPAAPGDDGPANPGDVSGVMLTRRDLFTVGPFGNGAYAHTQVIYEEWFMRLQAVAGSVHGVSGAFRHVALPNPVDMDGFASEANEMLARWAPLQSETKEEAPLDAKAPNWAGSRPKISLCLITKDEERFLSQCLASAQHAVDEIVVVDTGSVDRTVAIAQEFGARVLHYDWHDDFAAARNHALQAATGDWILSLDADEVLEPDAASKIRELADNPGVSGYHMHFRNLYTTKKTLGVLMVRLFRKLPGVRWDNRIHEQVTPSLARIGAQHGLTLSTCDIQVDHHGYLDEVMESRNKNERNDALFRQHVAEHPDDVYMLYKYGDFIRRFPGRIDEAKGYLGRALELIQRMPPAAARGIPYAGEIAALLVLEHAREERYDEAVSVLEEAFRRFTPTPNLHYLAASVALSQNNNDAAIRHYRQCLAYRDQVLVVPIQDGVTSYVSIAGIAQAWLQKGDREKARELLQQAIHIEPQYEVATLVLSRLLWEGGDAAQGLDVLMRFLAENPESAGVSQQASLLLAQLGLKDQACRLGEHAVGLLEKQSLDLEATRLRENLAALTA